MRTSATQMSIFSSSPLGKFIHHHFIVLSEHSIIIISLSSRNIHSSSAHCSLGTSIHISITEEHDHSNSDSDTLAKTGSNDPFGLAGQEEGLISIRIQESYSEGLWKSWTLAWYHVIDIHIHGRPTEGRRKAYDYGWKYGFVRTGTWPLVYVKASPRWAIRQLLVTLLHLWLLYSIPHTRLYISGARTHRQGCFLHLICRRQKSTHSGKKWEIFLQLQATRSAPSTLYKTSTIWSLSA